MAGAQGAWRSHLETLDPQSLLSDEHKPTHVATLVLEPGTISALKGTATRKGKVRQRIGAKELREANGDEHLSALLLG